MQPGLTSTDHWQGADGPVKLAGEGADVPNLLAPALAQEGQERERDRERADRVDGQVLLQTSHRAVEEPRRQRRSAAKFKAWA